MANVQGSMSNAQCSLFIVQRAKFNIQCPCLLPSVQC